MTSTSSSLDAGTTHRGELQGWVDRRQLLAAYTIVFALAWGITFFVLIGLRGNIPDPLQLVFGPWWACS